tara:strand:+ start:7078 stop:7755 length:678 start_codon:yes stop_codon:yes gene_type:complete
MCSILFNANSNSKELWNEKINKGLSKIKSIPTGELLITTIDTIIKNNRGSVTIQPRERYYSGSNSYPKITYYNGKNDINIIIPDEPYRTMVKVIDQNFINKCFINKKNVDISAKYLAYICNLIEVPYEIIINKGIKKNEKKHMIIVDGFCFEEEQPFEIILAHEMIHALRLLLDINNESLEEECTIFGVKDLTLKVGTTFITENQIRKELGYAMRVNHRGRIINE